jgi:hypothetical protein
MGEGVVPDLVPLVQFAEQEIVMELGVLPDDEEGGRHPPRPEGVQDRRGIERVGAVVEGDRDRLRLPPIAPDHVGRGE